MRMSIAPGYTAEEIRALVFDYENQPWGSKQEWLAGQGISRDRFRRWRETVFDGDLDRGLIPRDGEGMTSVRQRRVIAKDQKIRDEENERLRARVGELEEANEALGKAIGLLHRLSAHEPDTPLTSGPKSS